MRKRGIEEGREKKRKDRIRNGGKGRERLEWMKKGGNGAKL